MDTKLYSNVDLKNIQPSKIIGDSDFAKGLIGMPIITITKQLLKYFCLGKLSLQSVVDRLLPMLQSDSENPDRTKFLVHLTIMLHTDHLEVEEACEDMTIFPFVPMFTEKGYSPDSYVKLVVELGLEYYFDNMASSLKGKSKFVDELIRLKDWGCSTDIPDNLSKLQFGWKDTLVPYPISSDTILTRNVDIEPVICLLMDNIERGQAIDRILENLAAESVEEIKQKLVKQLFGTGISSESFSKMDFQTILHSVRNRMRMLPKVSMINKGQCGNDIFILALQNPLLVVKATVVTSVRSQRWDLLEQINSFLDLEIGPNFATKILPSTTTVLEYSLYELVIEFDEADANWHFFWNGLSTLATKNYITFSSLIHVLVLLVEEFANLDLEQNWSNAIRLFRNVIKSAVDIEKFTEITQKEIRRLIQTIQHMTYVVQANDSIVMHIREICIELNDLISGGLTEDENHEVETCAFDFASGSILSFGFLYIRSPALRTKIQSKFENEPTIAAYAEDLNDVIKILVTLIGETFRCEWTALLNFIINILLPLNSNLQSIGLSALMNQSIVHAFRSQSISLSKYLDFYRFTMEFMKSVNREFLTAQSNQQDLISALASFIYLIYYPQYHQKKVKWSRVALQEKAPLVQKILIFIHDLIKQESAGYDATAKLILHDIMIMISRTLCAHEVFGCGCLETVDVIQKILRNVDSSDN